MDLDRILKPDEIINRLKYAEKRCVKGYYYILIRPDLRDRIIELLKKQEVRELTIEEWREWKTNQRRDPICLLWENDTSPMWILNPNNVHEPALMMGKLKLFNGKPTQEQCKGVKWE